jgi:hypothetical protein
MDYSTFDVVQQGVLRWSKSKIYGDDKDSFTSFPSENYFGMSGNFGRINGLYFSSARMYVLLEKFIGYIPIRERSVVNGSSGGLVIGETGEFERLEDASKAIGCSHRFGVIPVKDGILWFDKVNNAFYQIIGDKFGICQQLTSYYRKLGIVDWKEYDWWLSNAGIIGGFEKDTGLAYISIKDPDFYTTKGNPDRSEGQPDSIQVWNPGPSATICYYPDEDYVNGLISIRPTGYLQFGGKLFTAADNVLYVHNLPTSKQGEFYGTVYGSKLSFILSDANHLDKVWDHWVMLGNQIPPTRMTYTTEDATIMEEIATGMRITNRYIDYQGGRYYGSMPVEGKPNEGRRLYGDTILIEIEFDNSLNVKAFVKEFLFEYREVMK